MSDILLMFFVEYLRKIYDKDIPAKFQRKFDENLLNNNFPDGCNQVYFKETLDSLILQRKLFVLEPCSFREKEYYLLTQKNLREIYKDHQSVFVTIQGFGVK